MHPLAEVMPESDAPASRFPSRAYRPDIDGLRALAVSSVVAYHVGVRWFSGGFVGVDIFFVISGYLICSLIYKELQQNSFSFAKFYARRAKRILPALYVVLAFTYLAACILLSPLEITTFARNALATLFSGSNIRFWFTANYFSPNSRLNPLLMTWSLGVEEQFYILFPALMYVLFKIGRRRIFLLLAVICLLSFSLSVWDVQFHPARAFYMLHARAWELAIGALLAIYESRSASSGIGRPRWFYEVAGLAGLVLLLYPIFFYSKNTVFPGASAIAPVAGAGLFILANGSAVNRIFAARPLVFIGLVSYSWYLWHWPMLSFARVISDRELSIPVAGFIALASFGAAVLSYRFVEQPFRHSSSRNRTILVGYGIASLVMMVPALFFTASGGWPQRFPGITSIEQDTEILSADPCLLPYGKTVPDLSSKCVSRGKSGEAIGLIGDSHAAALAAALKQKAQADGLGFYQLTKASCQPLVGVSRWMPDHPRHSAECTAFNKQVSELVRNNPDIKVVFLAGYWSGPLVNASSGERYIANSQKAKEVSPGESNNNLQLGLSTMVRELVASGKQVVVFKDVPAFDFDPRRYVLANYIPIRRGLAGYFSGDVKHETYSVPRARAISPEDDSAAHIIDAIGESQPSLTIYDPKSALCDGNLCYFDDGKVLLYDDIEHVSPQGAERAVRGLALRASR